MKWRELGCDALIGEFAPDILEMLMAGQQPRRMNLIWFQRNPLPVDWEAQRQIVKRFEGDE